MIDVMELPPDVVDVVMFRKIEKTSLEQAKLDPVLVERLVSDSNHAVPPLFVGNDGTEAPAAWLESELNFRPKLGPFFL